MITPAALRLPTVAFRALIAAAALTGLVIECAYGSVPVVLSFFTIWTNILVAVVFALSAVRAHRREPDVAPLWRGGVLLFILITGLVFHLVLANPSSPFNVVEDLAELSGAKAVANQLLHTVTPIGAVLDFLLLTTPAPCIRATPRSGWRTRCSTWPSPWPAAPSSPPTSRPATRTPSSTPPSTATPGSH